MSIDKDDYKDYSDKQELMDIVFNHKYPNGVLGIKISDYKVYQQMQKDGNLPKSWKHLSALTQFIQRTKKYHKEGIVIKKQYNEIKIIEFVKPYFKNIELTDREKFRVFWKRKNDGSRSQLLDWLAVPYLQNGIPVADVCIEMTKDFEENGYLDATTIRRYISNRYKNTRKKKFIHTEKLSMDDLK